MHRQPGTIRLPTPVSGNVHTPQGTTILEVAMLDVLPGQTDAFERAFGKAKSIIASMPGFLGLELQRCIERPDRYVLLVRWRALDDHTEGFRKSAEYQRWKDLLHHFYDPFPQVEHYRLLTSETSAADG